jgi:hypothetical protein
MAKPGRVLRGSSWATAGRETHPATVATWKDHFVCSRDICLLDQTVVIPAGGRTLFLEDTGTAPKLKATGEVPDFHGKEFPATFGQSADDEGNVYVQWHRRDNAGRTDIMRLEGRCGEDGRSSPADADQHPHGRTAQLCSGECARRRGFPHAPGEWRRASAGIARRSRAAGPEREGSICPPTLTKQHVIAGALDGRCRSCRLAAEGRWS